MVQICKLFKALEILGKTYIMEQKSVMFKHKYVFLLFVFISINNSKQNYLHVHCTYIYECIVQT